MVKCDSEFKHFKNNKHGQVSLILEFFCLVYLDFDIGIQLK